MKRTAVIHFEGAVKKELLRDPHATFGSEYYSSPSFAARANSTLRLNIVNYLALRNLSLEHPIDIFSYHDFSGEIAFLLDYEQIVVNTVASAHTKELLEKLIPLLEGRSDGPELIIGTEYSWLNRVRDGSLTEDFVKSVYRDHLLLRHTAKTDRHVYETNTLRDARVQEFPLGIDTSSMPLPLPPSERRDILFVAAPEGRSTKNNDEIFEIVEELKAEGLDAAHPIHVLHPPYTTYQYWEALRNARYLVFTSLGETFSYVLNDAAAMGVIPIRRPELFVSRTSTFGVDAYWDVGLRYQPAKGVAELITTMSEDEDRVRRESYRCAAVTRRRFSLEAVESNWQKLLEGHTLNDSKMLVTDVSALPGGLDEAFERARQLECKIVLAYMSRGLEGTGLTSYSVLDASGAIAAVPFCYKESGTRLRIVSPDLANGRIVDEMSLDNTTEYLRLLVRTNGISTACIDEAASDPFLVSALSQVDYLEGRDLKPIRLQHI